MNNVVTYEQFRFDVYLVTAANGRLEDQRVIATFSTDQLSHEFAVWYSAKHQAQLLINDLRTDALIYVPELTGKLKYAMQPQEAKVSSKNGYSGSPAQILDQAITDPKAKKLWNKVKSAEPEPVKATPPASTRDIAIALLRVLKDKDAKPWPARKVAEKAGMSYTVEVRRTLLKMRDKGLVVFDNGRWIKA